MEVAKTFDRNGVRYRPGDPLPEGLDKTTLDHYKRHGMVREVKPGETKPATPTRRSRSAAPKNTPAAGEQKPAETKDATGSEASGADPASTSDTKQSEDEQQPAQAATDAVATTDNPAAPGADQA